MINNFKLIEPLIQFTNPGDFYFVQLLKRQKDNPDMTRNMVNVDNFFIYSLDEYRSMEQKIIEISNIHNARAYIRVNRRNTEKLALETNIKISKLLLSKDYKAVKNAYLRVAGEFHSEPQRRWIVDIDKVVPLHQWDNYVSEIKQIIFKLHDELRGYSKSAPSHKILMDVETKNGLHIITQPFNKEKWLQQLNSLGYKIDLHEDNPTILYIP